MINRPELPDELLALVGNLCNGTLDEHGMAALQEHLRTDTAACDLYIDYMTLHSDLQWADHSLRRVLGVESTIDPQEPAADAMTVAPRRDRRPNRPPRFSSLTRFAAAALLVFGFVFAITRLVADSRPATHDRDPVAALIDSGDAVWAVPAENPGSVLRNPSVGQQLPSGWLHLQSGSATLVFTSGARVTLRGPAKFALNSPLRGFLRSGELTAYCPPAARGFTVGAPGCAVVDLGTEFGMRVDPGGRTRVYVKRGRVSLQIPDEPDRPLHAGAGVAVDKGRVVALPPDPEWATPQALSTLQIFTSPAQPEGTFHPLADDLVNAGQPTLEKAEAVNPFAHPATGLDVRFINNGRTDYTGASNRTDGGFAAYDGGGVVFTLNTSLHPEGYDLSEIRVLSGADGRRISHNFDVAVCHVGSDVFIPLAKVRTGNDLGKTTKSRLEVQTVIHNARDEPIARGVSRVRFTLHSDSNIGPETIYREIDVIGKPSPHP